MARFSNAELEEIRKALISATDTLATQGAMNPEQTDRFLTYVEDETSLKQIGRIERFRPQQKKIPKLGNGRRRTLPVVEGVDPGVRMGLPTGEIVLEPSEFMTPFPITDDFIQYNVEGDAGVDTVVRLMALQHGNDLEEFCVEANTLGPAVIEREYYGETEGSASLYIKDFAKAQFNGWMELFRAGHQLDAEGEPIGLAVIAEAFRKLPAKYQKRVDRLRIITSPSAASILTEKTAAREDQVGTDAYNGMLRGPLGIPVVPASLWPFKALVVEHGSIGTGTTMQLRHAPVSDVVITIQSLGKEADAAFAVTSDYTVNEDTGVISYVGGAMSDPQTIKVTYRANPQAIITHENNIIFAIGRDVRVESARNVFGRRTEYAITSKVFPCIEEADALVIIDNMSDGPTAV